VKKPILGQPPRGFYYDQKEGIIAKTIVIDTLTDDILIDAGYKIKDDKGNLVSAKIPIQQLLRNAIAGKPRGDGASFYVIGKFDRVYKELFGILKSGDLNNFVDYGSMFIKHAMHGISEKDAIGAWMLANDIAMITIDDSEKNGAMINKDTARYPTVKGSDLYKPILADRIIPIPIKNFYRIKEGGSAKSEVKGLMQFVNTSGLTEINPVLKKTDPEGKFIKAMNRVVENIAKNLNDEIKDFVTNEKKLIAMLQNMKANALSNQQRRIVEILGDQLTGTDEEVAARLGKLLDHATLIPIITSNINSKVMDAFKYTSRGSMPVIAPDTGFLTTARISQMRYLIATEILKEPLDSPILQKAVPDIKVGSSNFRDCIKHLNALNSNVFQMKESLNDEELTQEEKDNANKYIEEHQKTYNDLYDNMADAYNNHIEEQQKKNINRLYRIDKKKVRSASNFLFTEDKETKDWIENRLYQKIDRTTGLLKEGYCMISSDIARKHGLKTGDKTIISITPTDSLMGGNSFEIASILSESLSATNKIVLPSDYIQAVGKDYDVDVVSMYVQDKKLYSDEDWKTVTETMSKIYGEYVNQMYRLMESMGITATDEQKQSIGWKEAFVTNEKIHLKFMQTYMGMNEDENSDGTYPMMGEPALALGDKFVKDVSPVVSMRTYHTMLSAIGFTGSVGEFKIDPSANWFVNHIAQLIATNDRVDFPKRMNQLQYNSSIMELETKMYNENLGKEAEQAVAVSHAIKYIFQEIVDLPRGTEVMFGGTRNLADTLSYIKEAKRKLDILKSDDRSELIKEAKKFSKKRTTKFNNSNKLDSRLIDKAIDEFIKSIKIKDTNAYAGIRILNTINDRLISDARRGFTYDTYRDIEFNVFKSMLPQFKRMLTRKNTDKTYYEEEYVKIPNVMIKSQRIYKDIDDIDRQVLAFIRALDTYDFRNNKDYKNNSTDKDGNYIQRNRSLYMLREELVQIARFSKEQAGTNPNSVSSLARTRIFPYMVNIIINQKSVTFGKFVQRGDSITLSKGDNSVTITRDEYDQARVSWNNIKNISIQEVKNYYELNELFTGKNNLFAGENANDNKSLFSEFIPTTSESVQTEDVIGLLKDWVNSRKHNFHPRELKAVFVSLLVPYRNMTKLGRTDDIQTYRKAFGNYTDDKIRDGENVSDYVIIAVNSIIKDYEKGRTGLQSVVKTFEQYSIPLPKLAVPLGRNNFMRPFISQKNGYQSNDVILELARMFDPVFVEEYWNKFREFNPIDSRQTETDNLIALSYDSSETGMDFMPDFSSASRPQIIDRIATEIINRDVSVDKFMSKGVWRKIQEFKKTVEKVYQKKK